MACCVLHNICLKEKLISTEELWEEAVGMTGLDTDDGPVGVDADGAATRDVICQWVNMPGRHHILGEINGQKLHKTFWHYL